MRQTFTMEQVLQGFLYCLTHRLLHLPFTQQLTNNHIATQASLRENHLHVHTAKNMHPLLRKIICVSTVRHIASSPNAPLSTTVANVPENITLVFVQQTPTQLEGHTTLKQPRMRIRRFQLTQRLLL